MSSRCGCKPITTYERCHVPGYLEALQEVEVRLQVTVQLQMQSCRN